VAICATRYYLGAASADSMTAPAASSLRMLGAPTPLRSAALQQLDEPDRELVARVRVGDERAFEALYCAYCNELGAYVTHLVGCREKAQDVVHDLFLHLWEQRHSLQIPHAFASYIFRAARNRALDHLRHERVTAAYRERVQGVESATEHQTQPAAPTLLEGEDLDRALAAAVAALPPRCREVFLLNRRHGMTYAQVAETMDISPKTVEVLMTRALRELRGALGSLLVSAIAFVALSIK
jgi:RNA polymerase sigma-70 factor (ECF subfamily)